MNQILHPVKRVIGSVGPVIISHTVLSGYVTEVRLAWPALPSV